MEMTHSSAKLALFHLYTLLDHGYLPYGALFSAIVLVIAALTIRATKLNVKGRAKQIVLYVLIALTSLLLWNQIYRIYRVKAWRKFCQLYMDAGAVKGAEYWLVKLEGEGSHPIYCQYMRGLAAHKRRQYTQAANHFTFVIERDKYNFKAWQNLIQCLISAKKLNEAQKRLKEAKPILEVHFPGTQLLLELRLLIAKKEFDKAKKVAQKAVEAGLLDQWQIGGLLQ